MDNFPYNSLKNQLIQNGILNNGVSDTIQNDNFFNHKEVMENSPSEDISNNQNQAATYPSQNNKKRLNRFEFEAEKISTTGNNKNIISLFKNKKLTNSEKFLIKFFPKIYKARLAKDALKKLKELGINVHELREKTIPYGEEELRYDDLIKYIKYANEIEVGINKKFN